MKIFSDSNKPLQMAFWFLAIAFCAVLLLRLILVFSYVPETGGVSVNVLFSIVRILNGYPLYTDPQLPPYPIVQYMPLHYYIVMLFGKIFGIQNNIHAVSVLNRFLCLTFDLLVFIPVFKILSGIFTVTNKQLIAVTFMCIFLILPNPNYARVDNLYLLAFTFAVYFFLHFITDTKTNARYLIYAAITVSVGIFTKQSGLFLLAGIGLYLLFIHREWVATSKFTLTFIITFAVLYLLLIQNNYYAFYQNTVLGLKNGISLNWFNEVIIKTFFFKMYFFVAGGLALALLTFIDFKDTRLRFLGFLSIVIFSCSIVASLKWGSSTNYFTEFLALTFILGAMYLSTSSLSHQHISTSLILLFITPFFILSVFNDKGWGHLSSLKKAKKSYNETITVKNYLQPKLEKADLVFTDFHKENLLNILLYDHCLFPQREIVTHCTYPNKTFSYDDFSKRLEKGEIKYLIGKKEEQPDNFLNVSFNHFAIDTVIGDFTIYKYKL